ncbi:MAG: phosphotransferase [Polymorphobacter sp.]
MTNPLIVTNPARIDAAWMTMALRAAGVLGAASVANITRQPVGNGLVADSYRFEMTYDGDAGAAPRSVVGKFPATDPASRKSGSEHVLYLREVSFYRELATAFEIHTPHAYVAEIDPVTDDFTLLLADLAPARQGDQLAGCSVADAQVALREAAMLHAPRWSDPTLESIDWLVTRPAKLTPLVDNALPAIIGMFKERYNGILENDYIDLIDRLPAALVASREDRTSPRTLIHCDFRLDNMLFDVYGGARPMATLDWQTLAIGPALTDVAYFLSAGLDPDVRRAHESGLVRGYHAELLQRGITGFSWDDCWRDYRRYMLHGIMMGVFSALSVERTERGDALFLKMTRGACAQAIDHDSFAFWKA